MQTETFTLLAICEWFNVLNCRSETKSALSLGLLRNPWLLGGLVVGNHAWLGPRRGPGMKKVLACSVSMLAAACGHGQADPASTPVA